MLPGRRRAGAAATGCRTTASAARCATASTSPSAASACAAPLGCSDRGHTAASQLRARRRRLGADLRRARARAGSTAAASSARSRRRPPSVALEAMEAARRHGTVVSLRPQLPAVAVAGDRRPGARGRGQPRARRARRRPARQRGGLLGGARLRARRRRRGPARPRRRRLRAPARAGARRLPAPRLVATTLRQARTATRQRLGRGLPHDATGFHVGPADATGSRSSTASAAATRSPPG